jgi:hypothetical protein
MFVPESLWRLSGRYVNDLESHVNVICLEDCPSGRIQVDIMLEILVDIL